MAEVGDGAEAHHASRALQRMGCAANSLNGFEIGWSMFKNRDMHTDRLQVFFCLKAEDLRRLLAKVAAHARVRVRGEDWRRSCGRYWSHCWRRRQRHRHSRILLRQRRRRGSCQRHSLVSGQLTEKLAAHLDLNLVAQAHLHLL